MYRFSNQGPNLIVVHYPSARDGFSHLGAGMESVDCQLDDWSDGADFATIWCGKYLIMRYFRTSLWMYRPEKWVANNLRPPDGHRSRLRRHLPQRSLHAAS